MLNFTGSLKIFLAADHVDLRKSFTGLWSVTQNILKENPNKEHYTFLLIAVIPVLKFYTGMVLDYGV